MKKINLAESEYEQKILSPKHLTMEMTTSKEACDSLPDIDALSTDEFLRFIEGTLPVKKKERLKQLLGVSGNEYQVHELMNLEKYIAEANYDSKIAMNKLKDEATYMNSVIVIGDDKEKKKSKVTNDALIDRIGELENKIVLLGGGLKDELALLRHEIRIHSVLAAVMCDEECNYEPTHRSNSQCEL